MKWFVGSAASRRLAINPYRVVAAYAARNPRPVMVGGGVILGTMAVMLLIVVSSVQAFFAMSQQSTNNTRNQLLVNGQDSTILGGSGGSDGQVVPATSGRQPTEPVGREQTTSVHGIQVHVSIAANVKALIDDAAADGITLSGWGWRDPKTQIRLRRQHCGTSHYAIYDMPSSQCRPPTARPGRSQHERGLAIDFTYNGGSISTRRNAGFRWLDANAAKYGFKNLASEPWHWSTTGR